MKLCTQCRQRKPEYDFNLKQAANDGLRPECRDCQRVSSKRYIEEGGNRVKEAMRIAHLKHTYKLTPAKFAMLLDQQESRCGICKCELVIESYKFHVDHDHKTGEVRGVLCRKCNQGLGSFSDDPARLRAAAEFLERAAVPALRVVK